MTSMFFKNDDPKGGPGGPGGAKTRKLPLLPLRDIIVFPHMVVPLFVGREKSISALEDAMAQATRRSSSPRRRRRRPTSPTPDDIFPVGTLGHDHPAPPPARRHGEGARRGQAPRAHQALPADRRLLPGRGRGAARASSDKSVELEALMRSVHATFENYVKLNKRIPPEMLDLGADASTTRRGSPTPSSPTCRSS